MAAQVSSRGVSNMLDYKPDPDVISQASWKADAALTFHKLLNNLQRAATMYAVVDPKTSARTIADWALTPTFEARSAMDTYPEAREPSTWPYARTSTSYCTRT